MSRNMPRRFLNLWVYMRGSAQWLLLTNYDEFARRSKYDEQINVMIQNTQTNEISNKIIQQHLKIILLIMNFRDLTINNIH